MFYRVLSTEYLKLWRTLALWMVLISPLLVVGLEFASVYKRSDGLIKAGADVWPPMIKQSIEIWTLLMMPLFVTLETSLLAGLENTGKNWKSLLALPQPRWTVYCSKLIVTISLLWIAHIVLIGGTIASGGLLKSLLPRLNFGAMPIEPFLIPMLRVSFSTLLAVVIQHWVSLRWQTYTAAMGFGLCAMVAGVFLVQSKEYGVWFPWSLPIHAVLKGANGVEQITFVAVAGSILAVGLGCWEFVRRAIQ